MSAPPRVNGAHRPPPSDPNRSWLLPVLAAASAAAVIGTVAIALSLAPSKPPEPVSAAAGARPGAVPAAPTTTYVGQNVDEDGPTDTTTRGCEP